MGHAAGSVLRHRIGGYREFAPTREAARVFEATWSHHAPPGPLARGAAHRVLPEMAVSVAFMTSRSADGAPRDGEAVVIGPKLRPQVFNLVPGRESAAVRLKPEWVAPILGIDALAIEGGIIDLAAVRPALAARLHELLMGTRSAADAIAVLARVVTDGPASRSEPRRSAATALELVRRSDGRIPCERIAGEVGVSMRHLRRQVRDATGVSPKSYARVVRFLASIKLADASRSPAWADIAAACGYCDQSHLIRDSLALTGHSPRELYLERRRQIVAMSET